MTHTQQTHTWLDQAFEAVAIDDEGRACRDIPDSACREEPRNYFLHVGSLFLSKSADALIDPKLVLSWLMTALGAPTALVGLLVPIREAGALLPQLVTAGALRSLPLRKWAWTAGAIGQGLSAIMIAISALSLEGQAAGLSILAALSVLALSRSVCSVCYKDVLGKTVGKSRRGSATGLAGTLAAVVAIIFALILSANLFDKFTVVITALFVAGGAWILGSLLFTQLKEEPGATEGGQSAFKAALSNFSYLKTQAQLRRFILARALLTATALAPPFMVALGSGLDASGRDLGFLVLASASAAFLSSYVWGRLADKSSRSVLIISALVSAVILALTAALAYFNALGSVFVLPVLLFGLMIAYQGVRLGRSTHLVDMANEDTRAAFTALSNTIIGIILILGAGFSWVAAVAGPAAVIAIMSLMCAAALFVSMGLENVQAKD